MSSYNYLPRRAKIVERKLLRGDVVSLRLFPEGNGPFNFIPGQFVMISLDGYGEVPIGITTSPEEDGAFEVAVRSVGLVTEKIYALREGDKVDFKGPFGNGFPMAKIKGRDLVIVAGGIGLFPLRSLIRHLGIHDGHVKSLTILNGAKNPNELLYSNEYSGWQKFAKLFLAVDHCDDSWQGCVGQITELFKIAPIKKGSVMIVCGPPVMYSAVADYFAGKRIAERDLYFLLERRMKCGIGKCQHCTCGTYYVCLDGPIFSYDKIKYIEEAFC